jgi:hypothetical protein
MNLVYQWTQWLDTYETTAHTWTVAQTFSKGASFDYPAGASFPSFGTTQISGYNGSSDSTSGGIGLYVVAGHTTVSGQTTAPAINAIANAVNSAGVTSTATVKIAGPKGTVAPNGALELTGGNSHATAVAGKKALFVTGGSTYTNSGESTLGSATPEAAIVVTSGQSSSVQGDGIYVVRGAGGLGNADVDEIGLRLGAGLNIKYTPTNSALSFNEAKGLISPISTAAVVCSVRNTTGTLVIQGESFNVDTLAADSDSLKINFINNMLDTNYIVSALVDADAGVAVPVCEVTRAQGYVIIRVGANTGGGLVGLSTFTGNIMVTVFGRHAA